MKLVLKFLWLENVIAVCLDQKVDINYIPLTDFYFWPQVDAWEKMKVFLESEPFISPEESVILLNQLTEVINLWQDRYTVQVDPIYLRKKFLHVEFIGI
jgi:hypothetical protein